MTNVVVTVVHIAVYLELLLLYFVLREQQSFTTVPRSMDFHCNAEPIRP